ncbi:MAG: hypothetical protein AB3N20_12885 [Rhizobiaceae bacterium]
MEKVRNVAFFCVGRAVFFGSLAICVIMLSFSFHPVMSFRAGAILALLMTAILLWFAFTAAKRPPKRTEVWIHLDEQTRPKNDHAKRAFGGVMREVYGHYARSAFIASIGFFALSVILQLFGVGPIHR